MPIGPKTALLISDVFTAFLSLMKHVKTVNGSYLQGIIFLTISLKKVYFKVANKSLNVYVILNLTFKYQKGPTSTCFFTVDFYMSLLYFYHFRTYLFLPPCLIFKKMLTFIFLLKLAFLSLFSIFSSKVAIQLILKNKITIWIKTEIFKKTLFNRP